MMRELSKLEQAMCNDLTIVEGAYADSIWKDKPFSVSLPNDMTGLEMHHSMDGDQPSYKKAAHYNQLCYDTVGYFCTVADYPVTGDTLRFAFYTREDAQAFLSQVTE